MTGRSTRSLRLSASPRAARRPPRARPAGRRVLPGAGAWVPSRKESEGGFALRPGGLRRAASQPESDLQARVRRRAGIALSLAWLALAGLAVRLVDLQVVEAGRLRRLALHQYLGALVLPPSRGRIFDRAGRPLATNVEVESVYAVPRAIRRPRAFAARVAPILGVPAGEVLRRLDPDLYFVWLQRKVPAETAQRLRALGLGGELGFLVEEQRRYPNGPLAAHVLGFVGIDNQGLAGVELQYDRVLRGREGRVVVGRDAVGRPLAGTERLEAVREDGRDLVLTVDQVIQHVVEAALDRALATTGARRALALVMDPRTGEVLAMATRPAFDPARFDRVAPERWYNRPISEVLEPGSTFKLVTAAAALDTGRVQLQDRFGCPPFLPVGRHRIRDAHRSCRTTQTLDDIIRHSSNVGIAQVARRLGRAELHTYIRRFGFGAPTGIDLPGEGAGIVRPPEAWRGPGLETIAFGQGISATPLQLLVGLSAIANDGVLLRPYVVRMVRDREGRVVEAVGPTPVRQVVRPAVAHTLMRMLVRTVEDGTGRQAAIPGYTVAGKTGTAQKPAPGGGYLPGRYVASFVGFAPVPHPRLAALVLLDEPRGAYYGGAVAAPVFRDIIARALWYLRIPPAPDATLRPPPTVP